MGPQVCNGLKSRYKNDVACQGVGGGYEAGLTTNALPSGTSPAATREAQRLFNLAATKCPQSRIVAGGFS